MSSFPEATAGVLPPLQRGELERTWCDAPGLVGWLTTVDHKRIAKRYIVTTLLFFAAV